MYVHACVCCHDMAGNGNTKFATFPYGCVVRGKTGVLVLNSICIQTI